MAKKKTTKSEKAAVRDIGVDVTHPKGTCTDSMCPFHGTLPVRGQTIDGKVESDGMVNSVVVSREFMRYHPKYERYEKRTNRYTAHNPPCIGAKEGDVVRIMECRPLSKTKSFVVVENKSAGGDSK